MAVCLVAINARQVTSGRATKALPARPSIYQINTSTLNWDAVIEARASPE